MALERFQEVSRPVDTLIAAATWTILLSVVLHGLSATPLSARYARRLEAAKEPPVELAGMSELRQRRSVLASSPKQGVTPPGI